MDDVQLWLKSIIFFKLMENVIHIKYFPLSTTFTICIVSQFSKFIFFFNQINCLLIRLTSVYSLAYKILENCEMCEGLWWRHGSSGEGFKAGNVGQWDTGGTGCRIVLWNSFASCVLNFISTENAIRNLLLAPLLNPE